MSVANKLVYSVFLVLLLGAFTCSNPSVVNAADGGNIASSVDTIQPVKTGETAPNFTVRTVDDEPFEFNASGLEAPVVLVTFRGGWCPYCNLHLSELKDVVPELSGKGVDVYFLSGDRPEILYASLEQETQENIDGMGYTILSDADLNAARALGIAFYMQPERHKRYSESGMDLTASSVEKHAALPVPAVYVIDTDGTVTFSFVEPDYKVRLPADELRDAALAVLN